MSAGRSQLRLAPGAASGQAARPASRALGRAGRRQRRRRRLAGLLRFAVFLLLIFIAVWAGVRVAHAGEDAAIYSGHAYVVQSGDTLWGIVADEYGSEIDLRAAVYAVRDASDLGSSSVQPGETLTLPYLGE